MADLMHMYISSNMSIMMYIIMCASLNWLLTKVPDLIPLYKDLTLLLGFCQIKNSLY